MPSQLRVQLGVSEYSWVSNEVFFFSLVDGWIPLPAREIPRWIGHEVGWGCSYNHRTFVRTVGHANSFLPQVQIKQIAYFLSLPLSRMESFGFRNWCKFPGRDGEQHNAGRGLDWSRPADVEKVSVPPTTSSLGESIIILSWNQIR